jgi:hypothetical protein
LGKTVPSFRMALESEIERWNGFKNALPSQRDREAFEALMDMCCDNAMAAGLACNPIVFEPKLVSILLVQIRRIVELEEKMSDLMAPIYNKIWKNAKKNIQP